MTAFKPIFVTDSDYPTILLGNRLDIPFIHQDMCVPLSSGGGVGHVTNTGGNRYGNGLSKYMNAVTSNITEENGDGNGDATYPNAHSFTPFILTTARRSDPRSWVVNALVRMEVPQTTKMR